MSMEQIDTNAPGQVIASAKINIVICQLPLNKVIPSMYPTPNPNTAHINMNHGSNVTAAAVMSPPFLAPRL